MNIFKFYDAPSDEKFKTGKGMIYKVDTSSMLQNQKFRNTPGVLFFDCSNRDLNIIST